MEREENYIRREKINNGRKMKEKKSGYTKKVEKWYCHLGTKWIKNKIIGAIEEE